MLAKAWSPYMASSIIGRSKSMRMAHRHQLAVCLCVVKAESCCEQKRCMYIIYS